MKFSEHIIMTKVTLFNSFFSIQYTMYLYSLRNVETVVYISFKCSVYFHELYTTNLLK